MNAASTLLHTAAATASTWQRSDFWSNVVMALLLLIALETQILRGPVSRLEGALSCFELHLRQHSAVEQHRAAPSGRVGNAMSTALRAAPMAVEQLAQAEFNSGGAMYGVR